MSLKAAFPKHDLALRHLRSSPVGSLLKTASRTECQKLQPPSRLQSTSQTFHSLGMSYLFPDRDRAVSSMHWLMEYPELSAQHLWGAVYSLCVSERRLAAGWRSAAGGRKGFEKELQHLRGCRRTPLIFPPLLPLPSPGMQMEELRCWNLGSRKFPFSPFRKFI